jgi:predicted nucleic acid-binding protein
MSSRGLLDTSVFIARESARQLRVDRLPEQGHVCVITLAELQAGVLAASDTATRQRRLVTAQLAAEVVALPVDAAAAAQWARMRVLLHEAGRRIGVNDLWIASVALAHELPVVSQDADFDVLDELGLVEVVRV